VTASVASGEQLVVTRLRAAGCVFAEDEAGLLVAAASSAAELDAMVGRRVDGLPLEQILGWAEFAGLRVSVDPGVFVPRRKTELLVRLAMRLARPGSVVVDLCCGSGAIAAALVTALERIELYAVDVDPVAVECARRNLAESERVFEGDLFEPLPPGLRGRVDIVTANAPYVPTGAVGMMPPEARLHEPLLALDGGDDGCDVHRRLAAGAPPWLAPTGRLLIETSEAQAAVTVEACRRAGMLAAVEQDHELSSTVVVASLGA